MLGFESERRLKNLMVAVGDGERDLEAARTRLCAIPDFSLHAAFERVDRNASAAIQSFELTNFLRENHVFHVADGEALELVKFFDSDGNARLTYQEFIQLLLPCEDMVLRNITIDRPPRRCGRFDPLPRDIELCMTTVLEKEIDLQRRIETLKRELQVLFDYVHMAAFRSIDRFNSGRIDTVNLGAFLRQNGHYASEMELLAIIRRIDTDGDAVVNFTEFAEFMDPIFPGPRPPLDLPPPIHPLDYVPPPRPLSAARYSSPIRASVAIDRARAISAERVRRAVLTSPYRPVVVPDPWDGRPVVVDPCYRPLPDPLPLPPPRRLVDRLTVPPGKPVLRLLDEDDLVHSLKEVCNLELELETAKINLAHKSDFNLHDAFNIFDHYRSGLITAPELQGGLASIGCHVTLDECDLLVARYDTTGDHRLNHHEFAEAFLAHDHSFGAMVSRRPSNYIPRPIRADDCFLPNTQIEFLSMCRTHIRCENAAEMLRQRLNENPGFNPYEAFNSLDFKNEGQFNAIDLRRIIESRGYFVGLKECDQVIKKMDRNRNNRVSFHEFQSETRNRSPLRR